MSSSSQPVHALPLPPAPASCADGDFDVRAFRNILGSFPTGVTVITTLSEAGGPVGLTANSFNSLSLDPPLILWSLNRNSPSLVSFEAQGFPGRYLRIDSANPTRWPTGGSATQANRGYGLGWIATADQKNLTWVDTFADTTVFKSDATFRKVTALNGDSSMVSLQWYGNSNLYLRHMAYQLLGLPSTGTTQQKIDASFTLETQ